MLYLIIGIPVIFERQRYLFLNKDMFNYAFRMSYQFTPLNNATETFFQMMICLFLTSQRNHICVEECRLLYVFFVRDVERTSYFEFIIKFSGCLFYVPSSDERHFTSNSDMFRQSENFIWSPNFEVIKMFLGGGWSCGQNLLFGEINTL